MSRHIKFPLFMKDDVPVRTMEEFREYFDLEKMLSFYENGRLVTWLRDRYYDELSEQVKELDINDDNLIEKICDLLEIELSEETYQNLNFRAIQERNRKIAKIKKVTSREDLIDNPDIVAFTQEEFDSLIYDEKVSVIYICGDVFHMNIVQRPIKFIGINKPTLDFESLSIIVSTNKSGYSYENVNFVSDKIKEIDEFDSDSDLKNNLLCIAFTQDELDILIKDNSISTIYLYEGNYNLELLKRQVEVKKIKNVTISYGDNQQHHYEKAKPSSFNSIFNSINNSFMRNYTDPKIVPNRFTRKNVGSELEFGNLDGRYLRWIVISRERDHIKAITKREIEQIQYDSNDNEWISSDLFKRLNNVFYDCAFSPDEKARLGTFDDGEKVSVLSGEEIEQIPHLKSIGRSIYKKAPLGQYSSLFSPNILLVYPVIKIQF